LVLFALKRNILLDADDLENCEYIVPVRWERTLPLKEFKTFSGAFANQKIVCRLRCPTILDFLAKEFGSVVDLEAD